VPSVSVTKKLITCRQRHGEPLNPTTFSSVCQQLCYFPIQDLVTKLYPDGEQKLVGNLSKVNIYEPQVQQCYPIVLRWNHTPRRVSLRNGQGGLGTLDIVRSLVD
jgi:hypothetical protein